jgi:hypothetical protein
MARWISVTSLSGAPAMLNVKNFGSGAPDPAASTILANMTHPARQNPGRSPVPKCTSRVPGQGTEGDSTGATEPARPRRHHPDRGGRS